MTISKKIFFWSPMLGNVGTIKATTNSIEAIIDASNHRVYIINVLGEFSSYENKSPRFKKIDIFTFLKYLPKTGYLSKLLIYFFSFVSFPFLLFFTMKYKPNIIFASLVGYLPLALKLFFKDLKIINSIQGYPRFNFIRKFIWKKFYTRSDLIITMTENTKKKLQDNIGDFENIKKICNPIIDDKIFYLSEIDLPKKIEKITNKNLVFISIGRLTKQKNYIELLNTFSLLKKKLGENYFEKNISLLILGDGEDMKYLKDFLEKEKLNNVHFMGFQNNPFNFLKASDFYISTSLWEDPGHTLIEAASLKIPIITSDCPSGPNEFFNNLNSFKYKSGDIDELLNILIKIIDETEKKKINVEGKILNALNLSTNFSKDKFYNSLKDYL